MPLELLTDRRIQTAKVSAGATRLELRDSKVRGLELRVGKGSASKSWSLVYCRRGDSRIRRITLGVYPEMTLDKARRKAALLKIEIEDGADPASDKLDRKQAITFAELAEDWFELHAKNRKSRASVSDNRSMLRNDVVPVIGHKKAQDVTKRDIIRLLDRIAARGDARIKKKPGAPDRKTMDVPVLSKIRKLSHRPNRVFEMVRAIFRWSLSRDILQFDPTAGLKAPMKKEKSRERVLTPDEIKKFWFTLSDAPVSDGVVLALKLALVTAQRIGEVSCIARSELDLKAERPVWILPGERSKNGESHRIPLSPLAVALIQEAEKLAKDSPFLFPSHLVEGQPIGAGAATKAMQRARPILALGDFRVHDLRRTAATGMAELGINPHTISLVLNHISAQKGTITSAVYVKYSYDKEKRDALDAWGQRLQQILYPSRELSTASAITEVQHA